MVFVAPLRLMVKHKNKLRHWPPPPPPAAAACLGRCERMRERGERQSDGRRHSGGFVWISPRVIILIIRWHTQHCMDTYCNFVSLTIFRAFSGCSTHDFVQFWLFWIVLFTVNYSPYRKACCRNSYGFYGSSVPNDCREHCKPPPPQWWVQKTTATDLVVRSWHCNNSIFFYYCCYYLHFFAVVLQ